jgi:hypothetical protein
MENPLFEGRHEQQQQQAHPVAMNSASRATVLTKPKPVSPGETLQARVMYQARNQSGGL